MKGRFFMQLQILHVPYVSYITYVTFDRGYYKVNWSTGQIDFFKGKLKNAVHFCRSKQYLLDIHDFEPIPSENAKKVPACCTLATLYETYILEYIEGNVSLHSHPDDVDEVYLAAEAPFKGEFCHRHESHQTFCRNTLALKRIPK